MHKYFKSVSFVSSVFYSYLYCGLTTSEGMPLVNNPKPMVLSLDSNLNVDKLIFAYALYEPKKYDYEEKLYDRTFRDNFYGLCYRLSGWIKPRSE
ncbi:hypothetical protein ES705_23939 [subsurface metagenome]